MNKYLCKVADVFQLTDRLVVVCDTLYDDFDTKSFRHGSTVELRRPDGSVVKTKTWWERYSPTNIGRRMAFSVEETLTKADIPVDSEVWLVESAAQEDQLRKSSDGSNR